MNLRSGVEQSVLDVETSPGAGMVTKPSIIQWTMTSSHRTVTSWPGRDRCRGRDGLRAHDGAPGIEVSPGGEPPGLSRWGQRILDL